MKTDVKAVDREKMQAGSVAVLEMALNEVTIRDREDDGDA